MKRTDYEQYLKEIYGVTGDHPWMKYPDNTVFRHKETGKWFALVMDISKDKLGFDSSEAISVVNLKTDTLLIWQLREEKGIYPAYHMNKNHWITVALDGTVSDDKIKWLTGMSFDKTSKG